MKTVNWESINPKIKAFFFVDPNILPENIHKGTELFFSLRDNFEIFQVVHCKIIQALEIFKRGKKKWGNFKNFPTELFFNVSC